MGKYHCFVTLSIVQWLCGCLSMSKRQQAIGDYVEETVENREAETESENRTYK